MNTEIINGRLHNHQITSKKFRKPEDVVSWFGAMQAQDYHGGKWSIGLRLPDSTDADIEHAIADKKIIRTWPMRGTLHFVASRDIRWILDLMSHRASRILAANYKKHGFTDDIMEKSYAIIADALEGGKHLTKKDLIIELDRGGINTGENRSYLILLRACLNGLICQGPRRDNQFTFTLLDEWLPKTKKMKRENALAEFTRRYFESHGPATLQDFSWWSGLTMADIRTGIKTAKKYLEEKSIGSKIYWTSRKKYAKNISSANILQRWDEYVVAYKDRSAIIDARYARHLVGSGNGVFIQSILVNGCVVGGWRKAARKNVTTATPQFFTKISEPQKRMVMSAIGRYEEFMKK